MIPSLPALRHIPVSDLRLDDVPTTKIREDDDLELWKTTRGYQDYGLFLRRLNESVVGCSLPWTRPVSEPCQTIMSLLDTLDKWIDEIPPLPTPQRFGNLAFRTWGKRLESEADALLSAFLPPALHPAVPFLVPYLVTSFGSPTRMDYGTGHETSFALLLLCLTLLRFFEPDPRIEREIVLCIFVRYLRLCWRLQDVYKLEPAGSHGVWGLDDSHFLGYVFGSGELRDQSEIPVSAILHPPLPASNLYFMAITRIHEVKHGPFHEHSSQLYSIAAGVASWAKVNSGLFKMYEAEVLGKRVVVQHIPLGGLLDWSVAVAPSQSSVSTNTPALPASPRRPADQTRAPWARHSAGTRLRMDPTPDRAALDRGPAFGSLRHGHRGYTPEGLLQPGRMSLGPTASTTLRPVGGRRSSSVHTLPAIRSSRAPRPNTDKTDATDDRSDAT